MHKYGKSRIPAAKRIFSKLFNNPCVLHFKVHIVNLLTTFLLKIIAFPGMFLKVLYIL